MLGPLPLAGSLGSSGGGGGGVTSITGTSSQITASASTGAVTLSLPSTITGVTTISALVSVGTITTGVWNAGAVTANVNSIGITSTDGMVLSNTTAATNVLDQWSPRLHFIGRGWDVASSGSSVSADWIIENRPLQGAVSIPTTSLVISSSVNGVGYVAQITITSGGNSGFGAGLGLITFAQPLTTNYNITGSTITGSALVSGGTITAANAVTLTRTSLHVTSTDGYVLTNTTAATNSVTQQFSPRIRLTGTAWNSVGSASQIDSFIIENQPQTAAGTTTANLVISASIASGAYSAICTITSGGAMTLAGTIETTAAVTYDFGAISNTSLAGLTALNLTRQAVITIGGTAYYFPCATSAQ